MINIDKEGEALSQALSAMLKKAKAAGVKKPGIYFESEGSVYVVNTEHPGWDNDSGTDRCRRHGITPDMKKAASEEMAALYVGLEQQTPEEQLRRYDRLFECARIRGYFYDPDPAFDVLRIRAVTDWTAKLRAIVTIKAPLDVGAS